jgi:hypothetical protein
VKRLGPAQRSILLAAELYRRQHGRGPLWRELRAVTGLAPAEFAHRMEALRRHGLVTYTAEPRSLRVPPEGLAAALHRKERRRA